MKKLLATLLSVFILASATTAFAGEVYVTKRGKRFHQETCKVIQNKETQGIDQKALEEKGFKACKICFKTHDSAGEGE